MTYTVDEIQKMKALYEEAARCRSAGDVAGAAAAVAGVEQIDAAKSRRENEAPLAGRVVGLEARVRELGRKLGNEAK